MNRRELIKALSATTAMLGTPLSLRAATTAADANSIDAHCHIFNATDLQVGAFIRKTKLRSLAWTPLSYIADIVQELGWRLAPTASEELAHLKPDAIAGLIAPRPELLARKTQFLPSRLAAPMDSDARFAEFFRTLQTDFPKQFADFQSSYQTLQKSYAPEFAKLIGPEPFVHGLLHAEATPASLNEFLALESASGVPVLSGLKPFFRFRCENAADLLEGFGQNGERPIGKIVSALVDYDLWLGFDHAFPWRCRNSTADEAGHTKSPFRDQLQVAQRLHEIFDGRVLTLAPFNPLRAAGDAGYVALYREAITNHRCVGFKLYPPMGFSPANNENAHFPKCLPRPFNRVRGKDIDRALQEFYGFCSDRKLAILAHCADSNEASRGAGKLAGPDEWEKAFSRYPEFFGGAEPGIHVSLGHFGDDGRKSCNTDTAGWTERICALMRDHSCLYADFSYYDQLLGSDADLRCLAQRLKPLLSDDILSRLVYGSDWIMLGFEKNWGSYHARLLRFLGPGYLDIPAERIAGIRSGNATNLYRLPGTG